MASVNHGDTSRVPCLLRGDGLGALQHEPESFRASNLAAVRSSVEVGLVERSQAGVRRLAGEGRDPCGQVEHEKWNALQHYR